MKINVIGEPRIIMSNPLSKHNYFAWPSAARLQDGTIAVAASGFRIAHVCPFGKAVIAFSKDEGETYTLPTPVIDTVLDDRDAGLCTFGNNGLVFTSFNNTIDQQRRWNSKNNNQYINAYLDTVTPEQQNPVLGSTFKFSHDRGVTFGPLHVCPVTSPHGPIEMPDGSILWVGTTLSYFEKDSGPMKIQAHRIYEDGRTEFVGQVPPIEIDGNDMDSCEPYAFVLNDGTIICHIRANKIFTTFQTVSTDGGKTWTVPERLMDDHGGAPVHIMQHSSGVLIAAYSVRKLPYGIYMMFSYDNGKTWDTGHPIYTTDISADLGYPATVELKDGSLITVFYAHPVKGAPAVIMQQKWTFEKD